MRVMCRQMGLARGGTFWRRGPSCSPTSESTGNPVDLDNNIKVYQPLSRPAIIRVTRHTWTLWFEVVVGRTEKRADHVAAGFRRRPNPHSEFAARVRVGGAS